MASKHKTGKSELFLSPKIRGAYFYIHTPRITDMDGKPLENPFYEFTGLIPKLGTAESCPNYKLFADKAMQAVSKATDWGGQWQAGGNWPIQDGDADPAKLQKSPWRKGHWVIKFTANYAPTVQVLQNGQRMDVPAQRVGPTEIYKSGDYLHVSASAFTYDNKSKGVKFDISGILFVESGEAIGFTRPTADQMFAGLPGASVSGPTPGAPGFAPSMAPAAPVQPAPPAYPSNTAYAPPAGPMPPSYPAAQSGLAPGYPPMAPPAPLAGLPPFPR